MVNEKANVGDPSKGNKWQAIFANGYNSPLGDASLFIIDIDGAYDGDWAGNYRIIRTDSNPAAGETANGLSAPRGIDTDNNGTVDYVYAGDLKGNIWRFDLTTLPTDTLSNARKTKIFSVGNRTQAITTQPLVIKDPSNADQYIVVVSTGQWLTSADASSTYVQSIYGIVDKPKDPSFTAATKAMLKGRLLQDKNVTIEGKKMTLRNIVEDGLSGSLDRGWYIDLSQDTSCSGCILSPNGERAIRNMVMRGGYAFVNTVFPAPQNSCSASQGGATMSFNPLDGLMEKPMFDLNNDTFFNDGIYAGIVNNDGSGSDSAMIGKYLVSQPFNSDGSINLEFLNTNTDTAHNTGRRSWRQIH
jgi:type IV pilus assembly protein PilY1